MLLLILAPRMAFAGELMVYSGPLLHSALTGCCASSGTKVGVGALVRLDVSQVKTIDIQAYSDGRWNEGQVLKPFYLYGTPARLDSGAGEMVIAKTVSNWKWISSVGGGYFSHTTTTKDFSLPVRVSGFLLSNFNQFIYSYNSEWSALAMLQLSFATSRSDKSIVFGSQIGIGFEF